MHHEATFRVEAVPLEVHYSYPAKEFPSLAQSLAFPNVVDSEVEPKAMVGRKREVSAPIEVSERVVDILCNQQSTQDVARIERHYMAFL